MTVAQIEIVGQSFNGNALFGNTGSKSRSKPVQSHQIHLTTQNVLQKEFQVEIIVRIWRVPVFHENIHVAFWI